MRVRRAQARLCSRTLRPFANFSNTGKRLPHEGEKAGLAGWNGKMEMASLRNYAIPRVLAPRGLSPQLPRQLARFLGELAG